ncbi:MAG: ATP-binding cassette domain-containing protein [Methyloversatilis discipulorum]|jgi:phospholipid/cholesterol/gamma-HCH transport system ATP-binding protein|uniref:ABC transporter ATP-binding protein n=1 Tax=Methyloversatilis discipulorum TaxID=1119528 RepID=UPI0026F33CA1|nr:ATP-binding cassette domain-containing protein [Methyloversatilis discipulorum]MBV5284466.1 ATP-binding cassette domain-containing protein [Methyloversatilis discipulorum]
MNDAVIDIRGLVTRFGSNVVHDGLDLALPTGEVLALVGGSGSGKTTLLRQVIGLLRPQQGQIRVFGQPLFSGDALADRQLRRRFGVLFQQGALFSALNVLENIAFPLRELRWLDRDAINDLVMIKLAMVELEPQHAWLMPAELSGGMVKRVALARALALEPELLLLDEPTAGLDPDRSEAFVALIRRLRDQLGLTVVLVTHDLDTLAALATQVAVLGERRILAYGPLDHVMKHDHPFIRSFFCAERMSRVLARSGS